MNLKSISLIFIIVQGVLASNNNNNNDVCQINSRLNLTIYYEEINLSCDWIKFVDTFSKNNTITSKSLNHTLENNASKSFLFKFNFIGDVSTKNKVELDKKYTKIVKKMFQNFKITSFSLTGLGIKEIEADSFESKLRILNLSHNSLKRIDLKLLKNLNNLIRLDLSHNEIQLKENNFEFNKNLQFIDISHNNLHYLPMSLFHNVNELEYLNLNNNHLDKIDACILASLQNKIVFKTFTPAVIMLENNPVNCDCDMFFLNRYANFKLNLTCSTPSAYEDRKFSSLYLEDPGPRCNYKQIASNCHISNRKTFQFVYFVLLFEKYLVLGGVILIVSFLGCCATNVIKSLSIQKLQNKFKNFNNNQANIRKPFSYHANKFDTQNLIE